MEREEIETVVAQLMAEQTALGLVIGALMATAPDRLKLLAAFDLCVSNYRANAMDAGFELAHDPRSTRQVLAMLDQRVQRLRMQLQA